MSYTHSACISPPPNCPLRTASSHTSSDHQLTSRSNSGPAVMIGEGGSERSCKYCGLLKTCHTNSHKSAAPISYERLDQEQATKHLTSSRIKCRMVSDCGIIPYTITSRACTVLDHGHHMSGYFHSAPPRIKDHKDHKDQGSRISYIAMGEQNKLSTYSLTIS